MHESAGVGTRHFFVSYTREDRPHLQSAIQGIERLNHAVWIDERLTGGQEWWDEILHQIRTCDAVLVAMSPALLDSEAAAAERQYARALGKPLLPVIIRPMLSDLLPADLAPLQFVDYATPDASTAFELASAVASLPPAAPLPDMLPAAPPVPRSYVADLAERVRAPSLARDDQVVLVEHIRTALARPNQHDAAMEVLRALQARDDLFAATARQIDELLRSPLVTNRQQPVPAPAATKKPARPAAAAVVANDVAPTKPPPHWGLALAGFPFSFMLVVSFVAMYYAAQVSARWRAADPTGASRASSRALAYGLVGTVINVILIAGALDSASQY